MDSVYFWIILAFVVFEYLLELASGTLNLQSMTPRPPEEFSDIYDQSSYENSQKYLAAGAKLSRAVQTARLLFLLFFWLAGGFNALDHLIRALDLPFLLTGVVYIGGLLALSALAGLPFSLYSTFVIEQRFGFNRTTVRTFVMDRIKMAALAVALGAPILALVLWFFQALGAHAWLFCWLAVAAFTITLQFVAPALILPLFYKFIPLPDGELRVKILNYAEKVNFGLADVFVVDGSRRSAKSNAFFTGFGKKRRVALFDTLLEKQDPEELVAVLAHEIGHYKKKHLLSGMALGIAQAGLMFFLLSLFIQNKDLTAAFFMDQHSIYSGLVFFGILFSPLETILAIGVNAFSRKNERQADLFAVQTLEKPRALIMALKKLARDNLANLTPHPLFVLLHYSHPPLVQRVRLIESAARAKE